MVWISPPITPPWDNKQTSRDKTDITLFFTVFNYVLDIGFWVFLLFLESF